MKIHKHYQLTTVLVCHDISEIFKMSDKVFILEEGKIKNEGTPAQVFSTHRMSGKFQFVGEVIAIEKEDIIYIVSVLIGNDITKVVATEDEVGTLTQGDKVIVASKAFNPLIKKIL